MKFGPFPIRVLTGILLIAHGTPKVVNIPGTRHSFHMHWDFRSR